MALVGKPFSRHDLKRILAGKLARLFGCSLGCGWIDVLDQQFSRFLQTCTGFGKRYNWIDTESKCATFPSKTIVQPPIPTAIGSYEQIHAAAIAEFVRLGARLGGSGARVGQGHDGISL